MLITLVDTVDNRHNVRSGADCECEQDVIEADTEFHVLVETQFHDFCRPHAMPYLCADRHQIFHRFIHTCDFSFNAPAGSA